MVAFVMPMLSGKTTLTDRIPDSFVDIDSVLQDKFADEWSVLFDNEMSPEWDKITEVYKNAIEYVRSQPYSDGLGLLIHDSPFVYGVEDLEYYIVESIDEVDFNNRLAKRLDTIDEPKRERHERSAKENRKNHLALIEREKEKVISYNNIIPILKEGENE